MAERRSCGLSERVVRQQDAHVRPHHVLGTAEYALFRAPSNYEEAGGGESVTPAARGGLFPGVSRPSAVEHKYPAFVLLERAPRVYIIPKQ